MTTTTVSEKLKTLAKDLTKDVPRSPRTTMGGFVLGARMLDKCRAVLNGTNGEYHFNCPLDQILLKFSGIDPHAFRDFVATGADDAAVDQWMRENAKVKDRSEVIRWNNQQRDLRLSDLPIELQVFMEDYIAEYVPAGKVVYHWFDVYDYEEGRL